MLLLMEKIMSQNLKYISKNEQWLTKQLHIHNISDVSEVFLATCDRNSKLCIYKKSNKKIANDVLE